MYVDKAIEDMNTSAYSIYVLFETIGYILFNLSKNDKNVISVYEVKLEPKMFKIIEENRTDITGYVFQIFAALILYRPETRISDNFRTIFQSIINDSNWTNEFKYLAPGQSKVIQAIMTLYPDEIDSSFDQIFKIYNTLLNEMSLEEHALDLLGTIVEEYDIGVLAEKIKIATQLFF